MNRLIKMLPLAQDVRDASDRVKTTQTSAQMLQFVRKRFFFNQLIRAKRYSIKKTRVLNFPSLVAGSCWEFYLGMRSMQYYIFLFVKSAIRWKIVFCVVILIQFTDKIKLVRIKTFPRNGYHRSFCFSPKCDTKMVNATFMFNLN